VVQDTLQFYLADQKFQILVLIGGVLLGLVILLKLPSLFGSSSHEHHHHHHDHDHDHHDHSHAPSLWRLIVLALPLMVLFMGVPKQGFSAQGLTNKLSADDLKAIAAIGQSGGLPAGLEPKGDPRPADWKVMVAAASDPFQRDHWERQAVQIVGQAVADPRFADRYRLMRVKITCCAADAVPLSITVLGPFDAKWKSGEWVEVLGVVHFVEFEASDNQQRSFLPVIYQVQAGATLPRPYLQ
jgi:uncharacterized repeat protein (TIGR03943 family)